MTEVMILHHLFWGRHLVMGWWVWIHGDRMVARQAVDMMAGSSIHSTVGYRLRYWWSGGHDEAQAG